MALISKPNQRMTEVELKSVVEAELRSANGWVGGEISEFRREGLQYYFGEPFGNEIDGRSSFVSTDVQDVVESVMPDLVDMFAGGEKVVEFEPYGVEDKAQAEQATDYVNYIWNRDNPGFEISHDWIKDALLQKNGLIRVDWDETPVTRRETLTRVNFIQAQQILDDPNVEIQEQEEVEPETEEEFQFAQGAPLFNLTVLKTFPRGRVKIQSLPPEEFLISRRATDIDDAMLTCHKTKKTVSDLIEMGFDRKEIDKIPSHDEQDYNEERVSRFNLDDEWPDNDDSPDYAMREIWLYDCYVKVDFDGDNIAELRNVIVAGPGYKVLHNEEVDDHPFIDITPIRMPHKFFGRSLHELVKDIQLIKSTIMRQILDNMYNINNQRAAINDRVNLDDWLTNRPGGVVRVSGSQPVGDSITPVTQNPLGPHAYNILEYMDGVRELRTGITRYNQGLDPESLNKTATGINLLLGQTQKRILLIARLFAETGFKKAYKKILRLVVNNQDVARVIRLRNDFVSVDPRAWNMEMDVTVRVGLGFGTKETRVQMLERIIAIVERIINYQGGMEGPFVFPKNVHEILVQYVNAAGLKPAGLYFSDPANQPQKPEQPDPELEKTKMEDQRKREEMQLEDQRKRQEMALQHQRELQKIQLDAEVKKMELQVRAQAEVAKAAQQGELAGAKLAQDGALKAEEILQTGALKRAEIESKESPE